MAIHLLDLPSEILIIILYSLDLPTLMSCIATNRRLKSIIDGSALLQYRLATQAACVEDNPWNTDISSAQRLIALQKREAAFAELLPSSIRTIQMDDIPILSTYDLSGGIFVMTESGGKALRWISIAQHPPVPERLEFDEYILDFALAVPEDDLLVALSSTAPPFEDLLPDTAIKLHFFEISTRCVHRKAQEPIINVPVDAVGCPDFHVDICGQRVSLFISYEDIVPTQPSRLLIYDWRKGRLQMDLSDTYSAVAFLSSDVILLARAQSGALELWTIQDVPERIVAGPEMSLKLPQLPEHWEYHVTRATSNPKGNDALASQLPFHSSFVDSLVLLHVILVNEDAQDVHDMFLAIPRRGLLQQIPSDENSPKERLWAGWGPPICRWFDRFFIDEWSTIICGLRCAFLTPDRSILLFDFNPYTYKKALLEKVKGNVEEPTTGPYVSLSSSEFLHEPGLFNEQVHSRLTYKMIESREKTAYSGLMMDEEWIVGINDTTDGKFSLDVWYFG